VNSRIIGKFKDCAKLATFSAAKPRLFPAAGIGVCDGIAERF